MIELGKVTYACKGKHVLQNVSLKVTNGKIYGIFGLKDSGKSTLLSLMAGARELQTGVVRINGFDMRREPVSAKRCVGYCPQDAVFYPDMTVYELLDFSASVRGVREERRFVQIHEWMEFYGLDTLKDTFIGNLKPLDLFRLKLVQALVGGAEIFLLDSPTEELSASDAEIARKMIGELKNNGKTVFLASSDPNDLLEISDEIMLLRNGELAAPAPVSEWLSGCDVLLRVQGEKPAVLELLSEVADLVSCQPLTTDKDGFLVFRIHGSNDGCVAVLQNKLSANGLECSVDVEPCDETVAALRGMVEIEESIFYEEDGEDDAYEEDGEDEENDEEADQ